MGLSPGEIHRYDQVCAGASEVLSGILEDIRELECPNRQHRWIIVNRIVTELALEVTPAKLATVITEALMRLAEDASREENCDVHPTP
jgi:hypothetical protein